MNKQTSSNNVNAIYKEKTYTKTFRIEHHLACNLKNKLKSKLAERFITQGLIYITQSSGVSLEHNFRNTSKHTQLRLLLLICYYANQAQCLFLRQNNSSNNSKYITKHHELYLKGIL